MLKNLQTLNISKNQISDYQALVQSLLTLPQLQTLFVDLVNDKDAMLIMDNLPQLMYLNGESTQEENEEEEENGREIVQEDPITEQDHEEDGEISEKNPAQIKEEKNIHQKNTSINNCNNQDEQQHNNIIKNEYQPETNKNNENMNYNEEDNDDIINCEKEIDNIKNELFNLTEQKIHSLEEEIPHFNSISQKIIAFFKNNKHKKEDFYKDFQTFLNSQISHINSLIESSIPPYLYIINIHFAKVEIYSFLKSKIYPLIQNQKMMTNLMPLITAMIETDNRIAENNRAIHTLISSFNIKAGDSIEQIKQCILKLNGNISNLKEAINFKNNEINQLNTNIKLLENEIENLTYSNTKLKTENDEITNKVFNKAKKIIKKEEQNSSFSKPITVNADNLYIKTVSTPMDLNALISPIQSKTITKKNLLDTINEIYRTKTIADNKNKTNHLPIDTLEHHMYNYLKSKYGLKSLIVEWSSAIINGIKLYSKEDNEICLFGKILRNELEENSIQLLKQIKIALNDLISYYLSQKNPMKSKEDIEILLSKIKNGSMYLNEELWNYLCEMLFNSNSKDKNKFIDIINKFIQDKIKSQQIDNELTPLMLNNKGRLSREDKEILIKIKQEKKILYKHFFQMLLGFQIKLRSSFLNNFVEIFRNVDTDLNGVINEEQFKLLIQKLNIYDDQEQYNQNIERLIEILDPDNHNHITFSNVVDILSKEIIEEGMNALDKVAMM